MKTIIACDPETKKPAFSCWEKEEDERWRLKSFWREPLKDIGVINCDIFVIESQYVGKNRYGALQLAKAAGRLMGAASVNDAEIISVAPATWQSLLRLDFAELRESRKRASLWKVNNVILPENGFSEKITDDNTADAINIGWWYIKKLEKIEKGIK